MRNDVNINSKYAEQGSKVDLLSRKNPTLGRWGKHGAKLGIENLPGKLKVYSLECSQMSHLTETT